MYLVQARPFRNIFQFQSLIVARLLQLDGFTTRMGDVVMKEELKVTQVFCLGAAGFEPAIRYFMHHAKISKLRDRFLLVSFHLSILTTITIPVSQNQPCACKKSKR